LLIENIKNEIVYMTSPNIEAPHAFSTRFGGVSKGVYSSMNLGLSSGDRRDTVIENYRILSGTLGIAANDIVFSMQVHGADIRVAAKADQGSLFSSAHHQADGLITCEPEVALLVFAGDCVPILLHDPTLGAVGAVHAGWRGTASNVVGAAVRKMSSEFGSSPSNIKAAIGPCISKCCFETDVDVAQRLTESLGAAVAQCIEAQGAKYMIDLKSTNKILLEQAGVVDIAVSDECTSCLSDKYWSHRKTKGKRGSQAGVIVIRDSEGGLA